MKATGKLLAAALIESGAASASIEVQAAERGGHVSRGAIGALHGRSGGHWHGGWGYRYWYPSFGFYYGVPLLWGAAWGWPYYYDSWYGYPGPRVVYRDFDRSYPEGVMVEPPVSSTEVPRGDGAPTKGPLYMNYCESAKAYFPKVTSCPEGWRLATPAS